MKRITHNGLIYYQFELFHQVTHGVFTRNGGVSEPPWTSLNVGGTVGDTVDAVRANHELIYNALHLNRERGCTVWQVHKADTVIIDGPVDGRKWIALADGMVTDRDSVPLFMRYADCTPILLCDPIKGAIGIAHAGWRGTVLGAATSVVNTMVQAYSCRPSDILAGIGPSIGPKKYQVGEEVVDTVSRRFGSDSELIYRDPKDGTAYFNLWAANKVDLQRAGVEQIEVAEICTASNTNEFYSHRAENGRTGRFGAVMAI